MPRTVADERAHYLEVIGGLDVGRRYMVGLDGATIGRAPPADIVLADPEVSRAHCKVAEKFNQLFVGDLGSTNGTFLDGRQVRDAVPFPVGAVLRVGGQTLKHEWRTRAEVQQSDELDRDLQRASAYVKALLPPPLREGPIQTDWFYQPCAQLGGDAFGYGALSDRLFACYLIDVSGHGAGAAMHSVAVMNLLRQRALPNTDLSRPDAVLATLNAMFQMDAHDEMYFTMWYGVFDVVTRRLDFASAGHHAAYLKPADSEEALALRTRNGLIGAVPGKRYTADSVAVPPGASLYIFSDGVFEIVTRDGRQWGLSDFLPLMLAPAAKGAGVCSRLYDEVVRAARPGGLDDDFSLLMLAFD